MQTEKIRVASMSLARIMQDIEQGRLRVPRFQREFVWERTRIQALLDSMYKEYPIGTLFFWEAPSSYNHLLRDIDELQQPPRRNNENYTFILDGQQRLTSLYAVVKGLTIEGEDYRKIVIDLGNTDSEKLSFQYRNPDSQRWVSIQDLLSAEIFTIYNQLPNDDYKRRFERYRNLLTKYPFSVVVVSDMELSDAIEIFERINQQGRRLSRYDLIAASVLTDNFDLRERTEKDLNEKLKSNFGKVSETNIPQSLALNIKNNTEYPTQMNLTSHEIQEVWDRTVDCILLTVDLLRHNMGVSRVNLLPYDSILPVLQFYFYYGNVQAVKSTAHMRELEQWFWRVTFSERYGGASQTRMSEDAKWIRDLITENKTTDLMITTDETTLIQASMRSTTSAIRNGVLCLLTLKRPLHFTNATEINLKEEYYSRYTRAEQHHIFPIGFLKRQGYSNSAVHLVPNFCFIPSELNKRIQDAPPSEYFSEIRDQYHDEHDFLRVMSSHLIPADEESGIWKDDYELFLTQRANLIMNEIRILCGITSRVPEEQRNPVIDTIEYHVRETIHNVLSQAYGLNYWASQYIPGDVDKRARERIDEYVRKTPGVSKQQLANARDRLDFVDVADYPKIIQKNWAHFSQQFRSPSEVERYLLDFKDYRNAIKHNRKVDALLDHRGNAAILWLSRTLSIDLSQHGIF